MLGTALAAQTTTISTVNRRKESGVQFMKFSLHLQRCRKDLTECEKNQTIKEISIGKSADEVVTK